MNLQLDKFNDFKKALIKNKKTFSVSETNFTKIITIVTGSEKKKIKFNSETPDNLAFKLLNYTKSDAQKFLINSRLGKTNFNGFKKNSADIEFYKFYGANRLITNGFKVDIVSAYWSLAINNGLLSDKTIEFFNENKSLFNNAKHARLKALGSLATTKVNYNYKEGKRHGADELIFVKETKELYLWICEEIARVMQAVALVFKENVIYYYWDCLFFDSNVDKDKLIEVCEGFGYAVTFESATFLLNKGDYISQIIEAKTKKVYPIKK